MLREELQGFLQFLLKKVDWSSYNKPLIAEHRSGDKELRMI